MYCGGEPHTRQMSYAISKDTKTSVALSGLLHHCRAICVELCRQTHLGIFLKWCIMTLTSRTQVIDYDRERELVTVSLDNTASRAVFTSFGVGVVLAINSFRRDCPLKHIFWILTFSICRLVKVSVDSPVLLSYARALYTSVCITLYVPPFCIAAYPSRSVRNTINARFCFCFHIPKIPGGQAECCKARSINVPRCTTAFENVCRVKCSNSHSCLVSK